MMERLLVRVKPGARIMEQGTLFTGGQTFWVFPERFADIADSVDRVEGAQPPVVKTTAIGSPREHLTPEAMPVPQVRLSTPRKISRSKRKKS